MMRLRRCVLLAGLLAFLLGGCWSEPARAAAGDDGVAFTILHTSDLHAHLMPFDTASGTGMGGYARIKAYRDAVEASGRRVLMLSSGDVFQGTLFFRFFQGIPDVEFMNQTGYAAMALGNHEFDRGPTGIVEAFRAARFPVLSANLRCDRNRSADHRRLAAMIRPWNIIELPTPGGTFKLGLIGLLDERLEQHVPKPYLIGLKVEDGLATLRRELPRLRAAGADTVIVLSHLGWDRDVLLAATFPEVAGICGGHTHVFADPPVVTATPFGHQFITQPGEHGLAVARLDVVFHPSATGPARLEVRAAGLVPMTADLPQDPEIATAVGQLWEQVKEKVSKPLAEAKCRLEGDRPVVRRAETNLGNLTADSMLAALPADLAVINGGGIRSSIEQGTVTIGDCLNVLPFDNSLVKLTLTGRQLALLFEQVRANLLTTPAYGGFLQVSRGFKVHYGVDGNRLWLNGQPVEPDRTYTVTTIDFLATGGNGLDAFTGALASETAAMLQADALIRYVETAKVLDPRVEGRIIRDVKDPDWQEPRHRLRIPPIPPLPRH